MPFSGGVFSLLWPFSSGTPPNSNTFPVQLGEDLDDIADAINGVNNYLTPQEFGAVGDGITDDTTAITDWLAGAVAAGVVAYAPGGTYLCTSQVLIPDGSNVVCDSGDNGAIFDFSTAANDLICLFGTGVEGGFLPLTVTPALRATTITLSSGNAATFPNASAIMVASDDSYDPLVTNTPQGEITRVKSRAAGVLTLDGPLITRLQYSTNPKAEVITPCRINWFGGRILGNTGGVDPSQQGIYIAFGRDCIIEQVNCRNIIGQGIVLMSCVNSHVIDCRAFNSSRPGGGYGVHLTWACQDCTVVRFFAERCMTGVQQGGGAGTNGVGRRLKYINCTAITSSFQGISGHSTYEGLDVIGCTVINTDSTSGSGLAYSLVGANSRVIDCYADGCTNAIITHSACTAVTSREEIRGNVVRNCVDDAILHSSPGVIGFASDLESLLISDNDLECTESVAVISISTTGGTEKKYIKIHHNTLKPSNTGYGIEIDDCGQFEVVGNIVKVTGVQTNGINLFNCDNFTCSDNQVGFPNSAGPAGNVVAYYMSGTSANGVIVGNRIKAIASVGLLGLFYDDTCSNLSEAANDLRSANTPITYGAGAGHKKIVWAAAP